MDRTRTGEARDGRKGRVWLAAALVAALCTGTLHAQEAVAELEIPALFGGRTANGRRAALRKYGGDKATEAAVMRALRWLKTTQNEDGSWSKTHPETMTALCLLTFLARGKTPRSKGFGGTVQKAIKYLVDRVTAYKGGGAGSMHGAYVNGIVTYALAETYGMTRLRYVKPAMEKGLERIVQGQQPGGGFDRYYMQDIGWDPSVTGWHVQALWAGFVAGTANKGVRQALKKAQSFLLDINSKGGESGRGKSRMDAPGTRGATTLCLQLVGAGDSKEARAGVAWIRENGEVKWGGGQGQAFFSNPAYTCYYETQAMFHASQGGWSSWNSWNKQMKKELVEIQKPGDQTKDGKATGYWEVPDGVRKREHSRWYTTALCTLSLQVYYRYPQTYRMFGRP
ncbi:MAG: terpene cyclase/mutase family protein [Victivallales bacterium]|nr:terpene cyclase/mutase family protein [Victivallales bacterium]